MKLVGICLVGVYGIIRFLPFLITFLLTMKRKIPVALGVIGNAVAFLCMHYFHYSDFAIVRYVKNVGGMNFNHTDVEYFAMSAVIAIWIAVLLGILLRNLFYKTSSARNVPRWLQHITLFAGAISFVLVIGGLEAESYFNRQIVIREVCSNNESYVLDDSGRIEDYIEVHNAGILPCHMEGLYLSDDKYQLKKVSLGNYVLPAGGVQVVLCVDGEQSFSISNKGEEIYLSNEKGEILEYVNVVELDNDMAYTKINVETNTWEVTECTPGMMYDEVILKEVETPVLSHASGFYDTEFELEIMSKDDATVYYTLDGSIPDEGAYLYEGAIHVYDKGSEENVWNAIPNVTTDWLEEEIDPTPVPKAFIIRAVAVNHMGKRSDVVTATYFVNQDELEDAQVVSLIASPDDLFSAERGIYVTGKEYDTWYLDGGGDEEPIPNYEKRGKEWEREAVFELFDSAESTFQQNVGIRIQGNSTRNSAKKRLNIYTRKEYGGSPFEQPIFGNGHSSYSLVMHTSFIDALNQELMEGRNVPFQRNQKVSYYLNGEWWYDGYLREKYSDDYFSDYYGIDEDNLIVYKAGEVEEGYESDRVIYQELYDYVQGKDFSDDFLYEELTQKIDVQNYIEYLSANIYTANMDVDDTKNVVMFRAREPEEGTYNDGKWRFALYDMDAVGWTSKNYYQVEEEAAVDSFSQQPRYADMPYNQGTLYVALRQNEQFCKQFVLTFMDLLNTSFAVENVSEKLQKHGEDITWLNSFFAHRPDYIKKYLAKEFELTGTPATVNLYNADDSMGTIQINTTTPIMKNGNWSGEYYTDYPITVTANPAEGYEFVGWSGSIDSTEITVEVPVTTGGITINAEFQEIE